MGLAVLSAWGYSVTLSTGLLLSSQAVLPLPRTFCERLAPQLGMKADGRGRAPGAGAEWKTNLTNVGQRLLFGGTFSASFSVKPIEGSSTPDEEKRLENACEPTPKGALCTVEGPARLAVGTKKGRVTAIAQSGERSFVEMRGTSIYCRDQPVR